MGDVATSIYITSAEGHSGKSSIALGVLDTLIHEWVLVDDPEDKTKKIKCSYYNCVEFGKDFRLPGNAEFFILLEPGILYVKFHDPEPEQSQPSAEQSA